MVSKALSYLIVIVLAAIVVLFTAAIVRGERADRTAHRNAKAAAQDYADLVSGRVSDGLSSADELAPYGKSVVVVSKNVRTESIEIIVSASGEAQSFLGTILEIDCYRVLITGTGTPAQKTALESHACR